MTLWWIGNVVLLVVVLPVVVYLLHGVLSAAQSIVPSVREIADGGRRGVEGPRRRRAAADDAGAGEQTVAGVANYGGSLDVILDDADRGGGRDASSRRGHDRRRRADRPGARLLPRLGDRGAAKDHRGPGRGDRRRRRDRREERAGQRRRRRRSTSNSTRASTCSRACSSRRPACRTPSASSTACTRARPPPGSGASRRARRSRRRGSARSTRRARSRSHGSAARRRSPPRARTARCCGTSRRKPGRAAAVPGDPSDGARLVAPVAGHRHRCPRAVRAARRHRQAPQAAPEPS